MSEGSQRRNLRLVQDLQRPVRKQHNPNAKQYSAQENRCAAHPLTKNPGVCLSIFSPQEPAKFRAAELPSVETTTPFPSATLPKFSSALDGPHKQYPCRGTVST